MPWPCHRHLLSNGIIGFENVGGDIDAVFAQNDEMGMGAVIALEHFLANAEDLKPLGLETGMPGKRIIVPGLGKVGLHAARAAVDRDAIIVGVSVSDGALYDEGGLDVEAVLRHRSENGSLRGFPGARADIAGLDRHGSDLLEEVVGDLLGELAHVSVKVLIHPVLQLVQFLL